MTMPDPPPLAAKYAIVRQIVLMGIGILLLIPGGCSLFYIVFVAGQWLQTGRLDEFAGLGVIVWAFCFAISAVGILAIRAARRRARENAS
jgi:hypothetical protein